MDINRNEILRYLGYKNQKIDDNLNKIINSCIEEIKGISTPRYVCNIFDLKPHKNEIELPNTNLILRGRDIANHLRYSKKCAIIAATLGVKVDNRIAYLERTNLTRALVLDACSTEAIESICNEVEDGIRRVARNEGFDINYRYSPGYGDLSIEVQQDIIRLLDANNKIGLTCSESFILIPRKSVTAIIGFVEKGMSTENKGCESCNNNESCIYRRDGANCGNQRMA